MATTIANAAQKTVCTMCAPKETFAITSCKGCLTDLCRKHFNEHRDVLSKSLHQVFDLHDTLLQELQLKTDSATKQPVDDNACTLFKQTDDWEKTTINSVSQSANKARIEVERLFNRKEEFNQYYQKINKLTEELKEQQDSESFVETDISEWIKQLEQLKIDLNRPLKFDANPPDLQIKNVDWNDIINISFAIETPETLSPWLQKWLTTAEMLLMVEKEEKKELAELAKKSMKKQKQYREELEQTKLALKELEKKLPWWKK